MGWTLLIGVAALVGFGATLTEYDNIPLETSPGQYSRKPVPRPIYTASYGVAPGEYVLRSDIDGNTPPSVQGFGFLPRDQAPPQEYLDLLRQTGATDDRIRGQQQKGTSRVVDQQYFGIQPSAPYPASGPSPVPALNISPNALYPSSGPSQTHTSNVPPNSPYPASGHNQVPASNVAPNALYPSTGPSPVPALNVSPKSNAASSHRNSVGSGSTSLQDDSRQGSGKAVQLTYSLDYDIRTLHREGESAGRNIDSSSSSTPYYPSGSGTSIRGNEELLSQLAPQPEPLRFQQSRSSSYESSRNRKKPNTKTSTSSDADDDKDKIEVIRLPSPKGQRPITQEELLELLQAGYDITPAENSEGQTYKPTQENAAPPPPRGYQRATVPQNQLRLPKSRGQGATPQSTGYLSTDKIQDPNNVRVAAPQQTYLNEAGSVPSALGTDSAYYQTPRPVPLPLTRQQNVQPQVQTYQAGNSGIQQVDQSQGQQTYQKEAEPQPQIYRSPEGYAPQSYPTASAQQQQEYQQEGRHVQHYPTAAAQQPQEYQPISGQQVQVYQQSADPQVQIYQQPQTTQSRNEALSQPKEYVVPAPPRSKAYGNRESQGYQPTSPSAAGNDDSLGYQQALGPIPQGYEVIPTAPGATAPGEEIQRRQPQSKDRYGRRNGRRRPSSQRESRVTYIQRYEGDSTGYSTEQ